MRPVPGSLFAGYTILSECGKGAYGNVFLATDALGRCVALKYMFSAAAGEYEMKGLRNYMSLAPLPPSLLQIFHCGMDGDCLFYVMEAADNAAESPEQYSPDTLALRLERRHRLNAAETLAIGRQLLDGLEFLHQAGMIHRDIKPENIIFVNGVPKLADPGLTRDAEGSISIAGTPGYLAPELLNGAKTTPGTDLYALGKVMYRTVTGNAPEQYPEQPSDVPVAELYQLCRPLLRLCNSAPALRCKSCAEARSMLPRNIRRHGPLLILRDRLVLQPAFRRSILHATVASLTAILLALTGWQLKKNRLANEKLLRSSMEQTIRKATELRGERLDGQLTAAEANAELLRRQLADLGEFPDETILDKARQHWTNHDYSGASAFLRQHTATMEELAIKHLPPALPDFKRNAQNLCASAQGWGYLASPLGSYLADEQRNALSERLQIEARKLQTTPSAATLGKNFRHMSMADFDLIFVPPGTFFSPTTQTYQHLPYPYWLAKTEVSGELFQHLTHLAPRRALPTQSIEYLSWNDRLLFCDRCTRQLDREFLLPPGYAVRLPTEAEWEFAAVGGWANHLPPPRKITSETNPQPVSSQEVNALGIAHLDDLLAEVVEPYPEMPPQLSGAAAVRGADYRCEHTGIEARFDYLRDQAYRWGIGLRPVLAPTPEDYFQSSWYRGPEVRQISANGKIYAGLVTVQATLSWREAMRLAQDLGAHLPSSEELPALAEIYRELGLVIDYPCPLGIQYKGDAWNDLHTHQTVTWPNTVTPPEPNGDANPFLAGSPTSLSPCTETMPLPVLLLCWDSEESFARRRKSFLHESIVATLTIGDRHFAVCRCRLPGYAARPFAKFLGLRQPEYPPEYPPIFSSLLEQLPPALVCALGPIRFYRNWEQPDGKVLQLEPIPNDQETSPYASDSLNVLAATQGKLLQTTMTDSLLIELPDDD